MTTIITDNPKDSFHALIKFQQAQAEDRKTRDHVDKIFSKFDVNRDGIVTIEEFLESCLKVWFYRLSIQLYNYFCTHWFIPKKKQIVLP